MASCEHEGPYVGRACRHLIAAKDAPYTEAFLGRGLASELVCDRCTSDRSHVVETCAACDGAIRGVDFGTLLGAPETIVIASSLRLVEEELALRCPDLVDLQPVTGVDRNLWIGLTSDAKLYALDLDARTAQLVWTTALDRKAPLTLYVSAGARYAAVVDANGVQGEVVSLATGTVTMSIVRENYHAEHCAFPLAFVERDGRTLVCASPTWNRVDLYDAATGELQTERVIAPYENRQRPAHYLDYFHCGLVVSPDQRRIADNGWVWHPLGEVVTWSLDAWFENKWESEDGDSRKVLVWRDYFWDGPIAWIDTRLLVWGYGSDTDSMLPAVLVYDTITGTRERWFAGVPNGEMYVDRHLHVIAEGRVSVWDLERGARLLDVESPVARYHPDAKVFASLVANQRVTIARVHGEHATWNAGVIAELVRAGDPADLHVLGDALEASGFDDAAVLAHCRAPGPHGSTCWVFARLR